MGFIGKLIMNQANRYDPKYIIVHGTRADYPGINWQRISFKSMTAKGITFEKFNSVMMVKHSAKELKEDNIKHFTIERW